MNIPLHGSDLLLQNKVKRTKARLAILRVFAHLKGPVTVETLHAVGKGAFDRATAYRTLAQFSELGLVRKIDLQQGKIFYELENRDTHHHHVICKGCDAIEDIDVDETRLKKQVLRQSKKFNSLNGHTIEFFGICKTCSV